MLPRTRLGCAAVIGATLLLGGTPPTFAAPFDFETTPLGFYQGSLTVADSGLTLVITPEGFPSGFVQVGDPGTFDVLGMRGVIGNASGLQQINRFVPLRFTFSMPIRAITFAFGDTGDDDDSPVLISAFDASDSLLTSASRAYPAGVGGAMTHSLSTPTGAAYFIVDSTPAFNPHSLYWDVQAVRPVPEPATVTSLGAGLLAAWFAHRMKKREFPARTPETRLQ